MKSIHRLALLFVIAGAAPLFGAEPAAIPPAATPPPKQSVPNPFAGRFKQVRERIDALYQHRGESPPPIDPRANPFRQPGTAEAPARASSVAPTADSKPDPVSSLSLLQEAVATLRVSGVFEINGRSHLVINSRPYKPGDVVQTQVRGEAVYLRVREIAKRLVTLALNDTEMTLKF